MADKGYVLSQRTLAQLRRDNRTLRGVVAQPTPIPPGRTARYIQYLAKITGKSTLGAPLSACYEAVQVTYDGSGVPTVVTGGLVWGTSDSNSLPPIYDLLSTTLILDQDQDDNMQRIVTDTIVPVFCFGDTLEDVQWYTTGAGQPANTPFEVDVEVDGGSAGDGTTQCSFTYTVKTISSTPQTLLTGASPSWARPAWGAFVAATKGQAYINTAGVTILTRVDEVPDLEICGDSGV